MSTKLVKFRVHFICRIFEKSCKTKLANMKSSGKKKSIYAVLKLLLFIYFNF